MDVLKERLMPLFRYGYVGYCVNSVTHDINNYLGAILAYAELIEQDDRLDENTKRMLRNIQDSVTRCTDGLSSLTAIARKERPDSAVIELGNFVEKVLNLKGYDIKMAKVGLSCSVQPAIPSVKADRPKLALAILYVLINAFEAVAGEQGAKITVTVTANDGTAEIAIKDTGPGIPETDIEKAFQPFYTTKTAEHFGLGLTLARQYLQEMAGDLQYIADKGFIFSLKIG